MSQRFWSKAETVESGCHEWQSTLHRSGYGKFWLNGRQAYAHRIAWELVNGRAPEGMRVLHRCDNRRCVNPEHLFLGTDRDNVRDMHSKGRAWGRRKLTNGAVKNVLAMLASGQSQQQIANAVGVSQITVSRIKLGRRQYLSQIL